MTKYVYMTLQKFSSLQTIMCAGREEILQSHVDTKSRLIVIDVAIHG